MARLNWSAVSMFDSKYQKCLKVKLNRLKTGSQSGLSVFLHHHSWAICPLHALATMIVVNSDVANGMFSQIPEGGESTYMNRVLRALWKLWKDDEDDTDESKPDDFLLYTSHAQRHGSTETGNEHPDIQTQWLIPRGAWTLDQIQTIFNYICGTAKSDSKVGRALAGWPSADSGGACPGN